MKNSWLTKTWLFPLISFFAFCQVLSQFFDNLFYSLSIALKFEVKETCLNEMWSKDQLAYMRGWCFQTFIFTGSIYRISSLIIATDKTFLNFLYLDNKYIYSLTVKPCFLSPQKSFHESCCRTHEMIQVLVSSSVKYLDRRGLVLTINAHVIREIVAGICDISA